MGHCKQYGLFYFSEATQLSTEQKRISMLHFSGPSTVEKGWLCCAVQGTKGSRPRSCPVMVAQVSECTHTVRRGKRLASFNCTGVRKPVIISELLWKFWSVLNVLPDTQDIYENTQQSFHQNKDQVMSNTLAETAMLLCYLQWSNACCLSFSATASHPLITTYTGCYQTLPSTATSLVEIEKTQFSQIKSKMTLKRITG